MTFHLWQKAILFCFLSSVQSLVAETRLWSKEFNFPPSSSPVGPLYGVFLGKSNIFVRGPIQRWPGTGLAVLDLSGNVLVRKTVYSPSISFSRDPEDLLLVRSQSLSNLYFGVFSPPWTLRFSTRVTDPTLTGSIASSRAFLAPGQAVFAYAGHDRVARLGALNLDGSLRWAKRIKALKSLNVTLQSSDAGSLILMLQNESTTPANPLLAKFSSSGSVLWSRETPDLSGSAIYSFFPASDGGLLGLHGSILTRISPDGSLRWSKTTPGWNALQFIEIPSGDLLFLMANHDESAPAGLLHLTSSGDLVAARGFPFKTRSQMNIDYLAMKNEVRIYANGLQLGQNTGPAKWAMAIYNPEIRLERWYHWPTLALMAAPYSNIFEHHDEKNLLLGLAQKSVLGGLIIFTSDSGTGFGCYPMERFDVDSPAIEIVPEAHSLAWNSTPVATESFSKIAAVPFVDEEGWLSVTPHCETKLHEPEFDVSVENGEISFKQRRPVQARTVIEASTDLKEWMPLQTNMPSQSAAEVNTNATADRLFLRSISTLP